MAPSPLPTATEAELAALKKAHDYSIFFQRIFILDPKGNVVYSYPAQQLSKENLFDLPGLRMAMNEEDVHFRYLHIEASNKKDHLYCRPPEEQIRRHRRCGRREIDPSALSFKRDNTLFSGGENAYMEIVDSQG